MPVRRFLPLHAKFVKLKNIKLYNMKRNVIIAVLFSVLLCCCTDSKQRELSDLMTEIRASYANGNDSACLAQIDTLRNRFPKAIEERKEALLIYQDASLRQSQKALALADSLLEIEKARFAEMEKYVMERKAQGEATAEELTSLTLQRIRRDSLQTRFDVLCAQIRYIHKRQEQNEKGEN